jgi:DNA-binding FrmR family transcriptional regulator
MEYDQDLTLRLKKVEGQIRGIQKMLEDNRDCMDVIQQLQAVKSAINSTNQLIIKQYLNKCINDGSINSGQDKINELLKLLTWIEK